MDDKAGRRNRRGWAETFGRRRKRLNIHKGDIRKFLYTHKNTLLTLILLMTMVVLLFSIVSRLQPPIVNTVPAGETEVDYSTFIQQVKNGDVMAVAMRDNEVFVLLAPAPRSSIASPVQPPGQSTPDEDYQAWLRYIGASNPSDAPAQTNQVSPSIDASRALYTHASSDNTELMALLLDKHVRVSMLPASQNAFWMALFWRALPFVLLFVFLLIFLSARNSTRSERPIDDRMARLNKSRVRRFERAKEAPTTQKRIPGRLPTIQPVGSASAERVAYDPVTFADVAGIDEVRAELEEIVGFLRTPERYDRLGAHIPRGALLIGPPGTGKTLLAKAVAGEAGVPFFSMSASEFVEMFVGVGASRVRDLFNQARQSSPCVVFIDELDAVGRKRSVRVSGNDERDQTLNQLLVELDGFDARKAVVVMAATNRVDILDKALLRPGRFDRRITVSLPDRVGREAILKVHTRKVPLFEDVSLERLARMTTGMSGADLANLVNEAALLAARQNMEHVDDPCFEQALARVQLGALRPLVMSEQDRRIIAYHEGGHALVAYHLPEADSVNRVTILPRGQSLGVTQFIAEEDRYNYSRNALMARIAVGLGGRVAEELTFGPQHVTTGAENDLQVVTDLARRMVTRWGMSEEVGVVFADAQAEGGYGLNMRLLDPSDLPEQASTLALNEDGLPVHNGWQPVPRQVFAMAIPSSRSAGSTPFNALIDTEVQRILREGYTMARDLLTTYSAQLSSLAAALLEYEQLDRSQFEDLLM